MYDIDNVFAKIIKGDLEANKIYEDQNVIAFYDAFPVAPIHALVIPKKPYQNYQDFILKSSQEEIIHFFTKVEHVTKLLQLDSYRLITNQGAESGQSIFHFHVHIIGGRKISNLI